MAKTLDFLARHFDPFRDMEGFDFVNVHDESGLRHWYRNLKPALYLPKHIVRGAFIGDAMGCLASLLSDGDMASGS